MKNFIELFLGNRARVVATFGRCRLIETEGGTFEIRGGSDEDRLGALEWISLFRHEITPIMVW